MVRRSLARDGKTLVLELADKTFRIVESGVEPSTDTVESYSSYTEPAARLVEVSKTRLRQGWTPTTKPADVKALVKALEAAGLQQMIEWLAAFTSDEVDEICRQKMKADPDSLSVEVFRRHPDRELFAWLVRRTEFYFVQNATDLTKAIKLVIKESDRSVWIAAELRAALDADAFDHVNGTKWANRTLKMLAAGPPPKPVKPSKPVGDEAALLQEIARAPHDDGPRMVYGDWLLQRGVGWGECITTGCALARLAETDPKRASLSAALAKLEAKHAKQWLAPIRPFIRSWQFSRGMISRVTCDAAQFIEVANAIALRAPGAYLELTGLKPGSIPALAATPLGAFATVILNDQRIDDDAMTTLAASPAFAGVANVALARNKLTDRSLIAIATSASVGSLRSLDFVSSWGSQLVFTAHGLGALLASRRLGKLQDLRLQIDSVGPAFAGCKLALRRLDLDVKSALVEDDLVALVDTRSLAGLVQLRLTATGPAALRDEHVRLALAKLPKLEAFWISAKVGKETQALLDARADSVRCWYDS